MDWNFAAQVAEGAARTAGAMARRAFSRPHQVSFKAGHEIVTETDRAIESLIASILQTTFPETAIMGEEGVQVTGKAGDSAPKWWIDPIDGTFFFARGVPQFSISVACVDHDGKVMAGVVYDPMFDECFLAVRGAGATCNGEPVNVSVTPSLSEALLSNNSNVLSEWTMMLPRCRTLARTGSAALSMCYVACGRFDGFWQRGLSPWDIAAGVLIVEEAGGIVSAYDGSPLDIRRPARVLAANQALHKTISDCLISLP